MSIPGNHAAEGDDGHWVRWHRSYEDPGSALSERLRLVQAGLAATLDDRAPGPIRIVSICAGQGRDVIDVVATHRRRADVRALLVEKDPALVQFARDRAAALGVGEQVDVVEGDASLVGTYRGAIPADVILICGVFGNISDADIRATVLRMPAFCAPGGIVIWTRHRRPPDLTPAIRDWFAQAGFAEQSFAAPAPYILSVACHRLTRALAPPGSGRSSKDEATVSKDPNAASVVSAGPGVATLDPDLSLFSFIGDGNLPA